VGATFADTMSFLTSNVIIIVIIIGCIFGGILFIYMLKRLKKFDPFLIEFQMKKNQCKMFKKYSIKKVYIENNVDGLVPMGAYEGECIDKEGFHNVMFSRLKLGIIGKWLRRILFFTTPILDLILKKYWIVRCNINPIYRDKQVDATTKASTVVDLQLPVPNMTTGSGSLVIHCMGLQMKKYFTYPIMQGSTGKMIQDETINFERERDSVLTNSLYEQSVTGDTEIIFFKDEKIGIKEIRSLDINDKNFLVQSFNPETKRMELKQPSQFYKHKANKDGYEIITSYNNVIRLTGDHSIYTWHPEPKWQGITKGNIMKAEVRKLKKGDWIVIPNKMSIIEKDVKNIDLTSCKNHKHIYKLKKRKSIKLTNDILWTLGMFASEGWIDTNLSVCFSTEAENFDRLMMIFKKRFGLEGRILNQIYERKDGSKVRINRITFSSVVVVDMFKSLMKDRNWILQLPLNRLKYYLHGVWCGDGWHNGKFKKLRQINITTSKKDTAEFYRKIFLRFGLLAGIYTQKYNEKHTYWGLKTEYDENYETYHITASGMTQTDILKWNSKLKQSQGFKSIGDLSIVKINSIKKFAINDFVYDFSIPDYENFVGNNICCHNTIDFANVMREAINLNPTLRYVIKTEGKSLPDQGGGQ